MAMLESNEPMLDGPIPGESLTAELGSFPWQSPPQYANVDDVIDYYMSRMSQEDFMVQLVDVLEMGTPVSALANTIQLSGVMQGLHTIDSGILVMPVIMEMIMMLGVVAHYRFLEFHLQLLLNILFRKFMLIIKTMHLPQHL